MISTASGASSRVSASRIDWIEPEWPAPARVRACSTTRVGGVSGGPYASLNLAEHVGDRPERVAINRARLRAALGLPAEPRWLQQVHGCALIEASDSATSACDADAIMTRTPGVVCAVMTADCLPVLLCDACGSRVAAVHAGWRGLAAGILERACAALVTPPEMLLAWLGPAIGPAAFEVGPEVRDQLAGEDRESRACFHAATGDRWLADLGGLARLRLSRLGVTEIHGGGYCTYTDSRHFFSYRRDGVTGRMASLIWLAPEDGAPATGDSHHV